MGLSIECAIMLVVLLLNVLSAVAGFWLHGRVARCAERIAAAGQKSALKSGLPFARSDVPSHRLAGTGARMRLSFAIPPRTDAVKTTVYTVADLPSYARQETAKTAIYNLGELLELFTEDEKAS